MVPEDYCVYLLEFHLLKLVDSFFSETCFLQGLLKYSHILFKIRSFFRYGYAVV